MGIRGIPANYGGFETFAEQLAPRLVNRGHDVTVYGRRGAVTTTDRVYKGVRLVVLPTIHTKHLDTPIHTLLSSAHAMFQRYDVVLVCNAANALFTIGLRATRTPIVLNVDGIERLRKKWGKAGRAWYWMSEFLATKIPNAIVSDAEVIRDYYREQWGVDSIMIPYGARTDIPDGTATLAEYGLEPRGYILLVTRLEPENRADLVVRAFARVKTDLRLVIVGDTPFESEYKVQLREVAARDPRVLMTGFLYGEPCRELQANSFCYVHAAEVGGTSPALLESMALGAAIIASDTPQNVEVAGDAGWTFETGSEETLADRLQYAVDNPDEAHRRGATARERVESTYSWDKITGAYEDTLIATVRR